jgi:hypothetical protein
MAKRIPPNVERSPAARLLRITPYESYLCRVWRLGLSIDEQVDFGVTEAAGRVLPQGNRMKDCQSFDLQEINQILVNFCFQQIQMVGAWCDCPGFCRVRPQFR